MTCKRWLAIPLFLAAASACCAAAPLPTSEQAHEQFTGGKYHEAIKSISQMTASRDWAAKKFDKFDLLSLKAEAHLQLKESAIAAATFEAAAKEAPEKSQAGLARATAYLIKHSTGTHYVPKATANKHVPGGKPDDRPTIDIVDPEKRKEALTALWQDEKDAIQSRIDAASTGKSVQDVLDAAPLLARLRDYDFAAHGDDKDTSQNTSIIASHGKDLLTEMTDKMTIRVDVLHSKAFELYTIKVYNVDRWRRHGLEALEPNELADISTKSEKILRAAKILTDGLGTDADYFVRVTKDATRIHDLAQKLLKTDYSESFESRRAAKD